MERVGMPRARGTGGRVRSRRIAVGMFALLVAAVSTMAVAADAAAPFVWNTVNADKGYTVQGRGDPRSDDGAAIVVRSNDQPTGTFGGAIGSVDAVPLRGTRVVVDAELAPADGTNGVTIWLRVDGANRKPIEFATSEREPVAAGTRAKRSIAVSVPSAGQHVVFGVAMPGSGSVVVSNFRLRVDTWAPPAATGLTARDVLDAAIDLVQNHALNADRIDWSTAHARFGVVMGEGRAPADAYAAIEALLGSLGDGHSFLMHPDAVVRHQSSGRASQPPRVELLADGVGYVSMPAFTGGKHDDVKAFAQGVAAEIEKISSQATRGWIVDLRDNGGGNMWPMLAGLHALLGDEEVVGFRDGKGKVARWRADAFVHGVTTGADLSGARVAVLLGPKTASSGEAVAVAFHGRPDTRSFGRTTAGKANANSSFNLPDGSRIMLTTAIDIDRNGVVFGTTVEPDVAVDDDARTIEVAAAWLRSGEP